MDATLETESDANDRVEPNVRTSAISVSFFFFFLCFDKLIAVNNDENQRKEAMKFRSTDRKL